MLIFVLCLTPALLASTCMPMLRVRVDPGPLAKGPPVFTFRHGGDHVYSIQTLRVAECSSQVASVWKIERGPLPSQPTEPLRITYGSMPAGYREDTAAGVLEPGGCYHVLVDGEPDLIGIGVGRETIRVLPNGRIAVGEPGGLLTNSRPFRDTNRAAVGCTRGYRRARTAADSAAVDARSYPIVDARVTCRWLYDTWPDVMTDPIPTEQGLLWGSVLVASYVSLGLLFEQIPEPQQ
jgi:hypothetical protein